MITEMKETRVTANIFFEPEDRYNIVRKNSDHYVLSMGLSSIFIQKEDLPFLRAILKEAEEVMETGEQLIGPNLSKLRGTAE